MEGRTASERGGKGGANGSEERRGEARRGEGVKEGGNVDRTRANLFGFQPGVAAQGVRELALKAHSKAHMDEAVTRSSSSGRHPCSFPIAERLQAFRGAVAEAVDVVVVIDVSLALLEAVHEHTEVHVHVLLVGGGLC